MKYLLLCFINNYLESGVTERLRALIHMRQGNCDIREIKLSSGDIASSICSICQNAIREGYNRIFVQAATLVYSIDIYKKIASRIELLQKEYPSVSLTVFSPEQLIDVCVDAIERNIYHESLKDLSFKETQPDEIQIKSFDFISRRLGSEYTDPELKSVVVRVIHAVADFNIEQFLRLSSDAIVKAKEALRKECYIITDVSMVSAGLSLRFKNRIICSISQPGVSEYAEQCSITRSAAAIELLKDRIEGSIVAIGNAPTSLVKLLSIIKSSGIRPACVVGVPVGFVGAAESKEMLMTSDLPYITTKGNRGGSTIAVAIVNAIGCLCE